MSDKPRAVPVVLYASLSKKTADEKRGDESTESQLVKAREQVSRLGGRVVVGEFTDTGHSGSSKNRGPGLEAAIAAAVTAAEQHGGAELMANTSARFARGSGKRDEARAIGELFYDLRRRGVALRSVADDEFLTNELLVGFASAQASKYAADLSESVKRAKRRQAENGERLGGPLPIAYRLAGPGRVVLDPATAPIIARIFELAAQGVSDSAIARTINAEGHRTRRGRPFDRRAVQAIVTRPFYAGRIVHDGTTFETSHERLIDAATFDRIQAARAERDHARPDQKVKGAPARRHLLARLARCADCGSPMFAWTSPYKRKDGTRARLYRCRGYASADGTCNVRPVDAEAVDAAVMEHLADLVPDFDKWIGTIEDRHAAERDRLAQLVQRAEDDVDTSGAMAQKVEARWASYGEDDAATVLPVVNRLRREFEDAQTRLAATRDALASIPTEAPHDRLLDFAISLRDAIAGRIANVHSIEEVNRALVESFSAFVIYPPGLTLPDGCGIDSGSVMIEPAIRMEVAARLLDEQGGIDSYQPPVPPMAWIEALHKSAHSQA